MQFNRQPPMAYTNNYLSILIEAASQYPIQEKPELCGLKQEPDAGGS